MSIKEAFMAKIQESAQETSVEASTQPAHPQTLLTSVIVEAQFIDALVNENVQATQLHESMLSVLTKIRHLASDGKPIDFAHAGTIAGILAGVKRVVSLETTPEDDAKRLLTIRTIASADLGSDGHINPALSKFANMGSDSDREEFKDMLNKYAQDPSNNKQLVNALGKLSSGVDSLVRRIQLAIKQRTK